MTVPGFIGAPPPVARISKRANGKGSGGTGAGTRLSRTTNASGRAFFSIPAGERPIEHPAGGAPFLWEDRDSTLPEAYAEVKYDMMRISYDLDEYSDPSLSSLIAEKVPS